MKRISSVCDFWAGRFLALCVFLMGPVSVLQAQQPLVPMPKSMVCTGGKSLVENLKVERRLVAVDADLKGPEDYRLRVTKDSVLMVALHALGLRYAEVTLSQLTDERGMVPRCRIVDGPRWSHRGVMLDVSRHFFSLEFLKRQIDVMARYKLNRLHLHLTDAAGWRVEIKAFPRLTQIGAWRTNANWLPWWNEEGRHYMCEGEPGAAGGYYTQEELRELVQYAEACNVLIIPEVEMPAHSEEALVAYPELSCSGKAYENADFCPGNEKVYDFWTKVLAELHSIFPHSPIHIGGDEAGKVAWRTCPKCQKVMREACLKDLNHLQSHFIQRIEARADSMGIQLIGWDDLMQGPLPPHTIIQIWGPWTKANEVAGLSHRFVFSASEYCYIDAYQDDPRSEPRAIGGYLPLRKMWNMTSVIDSLPAETQRLMDGVEACLWTEYVPTPEHAERMLYPRVLALAEVGWGTPCKASADRSFEGFRKRVLLDIQRLRDEGYYPFDLKRERGSRPESLRPVKALSVGRNVTYATPYYNRYAAGGRTALTDGRCGGWTYGDGFWQGFIGAGRIDVTMDLERTETVRSLETTFMQSIGADVYLPETVNFQLLDADHQEVETICLPTDADYKQPYRLQTYRWKGKVRARYVRVVATTGALGGWLFTDEIVVR